MAESVFIGGMFVKYGREYEEILRHVGREEEADEAEHIVQQMEKTVLDAGWDGEWFVRAYDAAKNPVGSHVCEEGKIYIEPQGMCAMAGIGLESGEAAKALESAQRYLECDYGLVGDLKTILPALSAAL